MYSCTVNTTHNKLIILPARSCSRACSIFRNLCNFFIKIPIIQSEISSIYPSSFRFILLKLGREENLIVNFQRLRNTVLKESETMAKQGWGGFTCTWYRSTVGS